MVNKTLPALQVMVCDTVVVLGVFVMFNPSGVSLDEYRKALGPLAHELTEDEIQRAYSLSERMAGILFDMWRDKTNNAVK